MVKNNLVVVQKMLAEINYILDFAKGIDHENFMSSENTRRIIAMTIINIGELVRHLSKDFRKEHRHIPFDGIIGMRDIVVHGYDKLKLDKIWDTLTVYIPELRAQLEQIT